MPSHEDRLISLIAHDCRNALNAINMSIHMIGGELPEGNPELLSDFQMLRESVANLREMLAILTDYARVCESEISATTEPFDTRGMLAEVLRALEDDEGDRSRIRQEVAESCPKVARLDTKLVQLAIKYAVSNALVSAEGADVVVRASGVDGRWIVAVHDPGPPAPEWLGRDLSEIPMMRLISHHRERRGGDLAIVGRASKLLGGSARLTASPDGGSAVILDWPAQTPA